MLVTLIVGLAMAPLAMIRKQSQVEFIVAMLAFETIGLPSLITIILLMRMKPGPARLKTIVVLSLLPTLLIATAGGLFYLGGIPFFLIKVAREFAAGDFTHGPTVINAIVQVMVCLGINMSARCPVCHRRRLRLMKSPPASVGKWAAVYQCKGCEALASRSAPYIFVRARRLTETAEVNPNERLGNVPGKG